MANPDDSDDDKTPLMSAAWLGQTKIVDLLLSEYRHSISIDAQDECGQTSLMVATRRGYPDIVDLLLQYGADVDILDDNEQSAMMLAQQEGHAKVVDILEKAFKQSEQVTGAKQLKKKVQQVNKRQRA